jgi:hypothetical protein
MKQIILFVSIFLLLSSAVYAAKTVDEDLSGTNWDGDTATDNEAITNGGWSLMEGSDSFDYNQNVGNDYDGDDFYIIPYSGGSPLYQYNNASLETDHIKWITAWFYDDSSDTAAYSITNPGEYDGHNIRLGVFTGQSTTAYSFFDESSWSTTSVSRTTGWLMLTWTV